MTDVRKGDRVRVTYEGTVSHVFSGGDVELRGLVASFGTPVRGGRAEKAGVKFSLEVLERTKFRPGTVVRINGAATYMKTTTGFATIGGAHIADTEALENDVAAGRGEIVYEPPTE